MDLASNLPSILPLAVEWAIERSQEIQRLGVSLSTANIELAKRVGVSSPENIKVMEVPSIPLPENQKLRDTAISTGVISRDTAGLTLGYSIYICKGHFSKRFLSHELRHVHQYEQHGTIRDFLAAYLDQVASFGYEAAPMEKDARNHEEIT